MQIRTECTAGVEHIAEKSRDGFWYGEHRMAFEPTTRTGRMTWARMAEFIRDAHGDDCECESAEFARINKSLKEAQS